MRLQTKVKSILLLSICTLLVNCSSEINHKLETVDKLLDHDSLQVAASLLQNIKTSEIKTSKDSAYYLLLKTEIDWQKQKKINSDSTITYCIDYYTKNHDARKLALSLHYKSGILYEFGRIKEAIILEKKAEQIAKPLHDDILNFKIYTNLGYYNDKNYNSNKALQYNQKKLQIANRINNITYKTYTLGEIAAIHIGENNKDSAKFYIMEAYRNINFFTHDDLVYLWANMALLLDDTYPYEAEQLYKKALQNNKNPIIYGLLANHYYKNHQGEKAMLYFKKAKSVTDLRFKISFLEAQHQYLSERNKEHEAHEVAKRIIALKDSLVQKNEQDSIKEMQGMLDQEYMQHEARKEEHLLLSFCVILTLLIVIVITVHFIRRQHYKQQIKLHKDEMQVNKKEIEQLQDSSEKSAKDIKLLHKEVEMLRNKQSQLLSKGKQRYEEIQQGGNTLLWRKPDFTAFMEYYRMQDASFVEQLENKDEISSPRLMMFKTLVHMGYSKERIAKALCVSEDSLRTYKSRVKNNK